MRKGLIAAVLVISAMTVTTGPVAGQSADAPGLKPDAFRIPAAEAAQKTFVLRTEAAKRLQAEIRKQNGADKATVVCGMTVIKVDPSFDAAIRKAPPTDRTFTLRIIQPTVCAPTERDASEPRR